MSEQASPQKKSQRTLLILAAIFAIPYAAAFFLYYGDDGGASLGTSNNGQLISPVRTMQAMEFNQVIDGQTISTDFAGHWTMLTMASSNCDTECTDNLYAIKQVRSAIGVERRNVRRAMVLMEIDNIEQLLPRMTDFEGMDILTTSEVNLVQLKQFLQHKDQNFENAVFLFDPKGNYMMYYPPSTHPKLILKDMLLLMKVNKH
ncbi:MAG: hypothetical protein DRQ47_07020 [Gammaproteobacteria bacterium]|nr:MAG: hypothetical protein DRQ47_07020 [Gammaproteobacteria bacterium]